jgi:hypothetical protein
MIYPNGRTIYAKYTHSDAASTWQDETSDAFSRISQFAETSGSPGDVYTEHSFIGLNRLANRASISGTGYKGNDTVSAGGQNVPGKGR